MTYFIELYDANDSHIGTRSLRAANEGDAADETCEILRTVRDETNSRASARLFEQPPLANYREVATYHIFAKRNA